MWDRSTAVKTKKRLRVTDPVMSHLSDTVEVYMNIKLCLHQYSIEHRAIVGYFNLGARTSEHTAVF